MTTTLTTRSVSPAVDAHLPRLRCPATGLPLRRDGEGLVAHDGRRYTLTPTGIPLLAPSPQRRESRIQQAHYDRIAGVFVANLAYPHTVEYQTHLDRLLLDAVPPEGPGLVAEICCGRGEAIRLLAAHHPDRLEGAIGVDISREMLETARRVAPDRRFLFVQGDATALPLADGVFDTLFILGGVHHVNDRPALFAEIHRVLKPGGHFLWREPVDDLFLWRWLRAVIYRVSPTLDEVTESPLRRDATLGQLREAGLEPLRWRPCGFLGFCCLMNSDVLVVNRLLRFVPGIRAIARAAARIDDAIVRLPGLAAAGLQVVGSARKPARRALT